MAIRTHQSISGFVASDPQLSYTDRGDARLYMKVGIEHYRKEPDNTFTQLETTFHDLIAYRGAAEQGALHAAGPVEPVALVPCLGHRVGDDASDHIGDMLRVDERRSPFALGNPSAHARRTRQPR